MAPSRISILKNKYNEVSLFLYDWTLHDSVPVITMACNSPEELISEIDELIENLKEIKISAEQYFIT